MNNLMNNRLASSPWVIFGILAVLFDIFCYLANLGVFVSPTRFKVGYQTIQNILDHFLAEKSILVGWYDEKLCFIYGVLLIFLRSHPEVFKLLYFGPIMGIFSNFLGNWKWVVLVGLSINNYPWNQVNEKKLTWCLVGIMCVGSLIFSSVFVWLWSAIVFVYTPFSKRTHHFLLVGMSILWSHVNGWWLILLVGPWIGGFVWELHPDLAVQMNSTLISGYLIMGGVSVSRDQEERVYATFLIGIQLIGRLSHYYGSYISKKTNTRARHGHNKKPRLKITH
jgi:hypothetical protein